MKKLFKLAALVIIFLSNSILAQEISYPIQLSLYGGIILPVGDFSSTSADKESGFANTGYGFMLEASKKVNKDLFWDLSISLATNSMDESALEKYLPGYTIEADNYLTTWVMGGIGYEADLSESIKIYGLVQAGLLASSYPDVTVSYAGLSATTTSNTATSFAVGLGAGLSINKIKLGVRYYAGTPKYENTSSSGGITLTTKTEKTASILQIMIGYNF